MLASSRAANQPMSRKARAEDTRRRLVEAAIDHFSENHYDEVAVSDIAETAGVAHGLLFHYFSTKRGIYLEAMRQAAREFDLAATVPAGLPPGQQLRRFLRNHLEHVAERRGLALRLILGGRGTDPDAWELFEAGRWKSIKWGCTILGLDYESEALRMLMRAAAGFFDEATVYWLEHDQMFSVSAVVEEAVLAFASALASAARLDPSLDVKDALALLQQS